MTQLRLITRRGKPVLLHQDRPQLVQARVLLGLHIGTQVLQQHIIQVEQLHIQRLGILLKIQQQITKLLLGITLIRLIVQQLRSTPQLVILSIEDHLQYQKEYLLVHTTQTMR